MQGGHFFTEAVPREGNHRVRGRELHHGPLVPRHQAGTLQGG
jgi:hypothetical protein